MNALQATVLVFVSAALLPVHGTTLLSTYPVTYQGFCLGESSTYILNSLYNDQLDANLCAIECSELPECQAYTAWRNQVTSSGGTADRCLLHGINLNAVSGFYHNRALIPPQSVNWGQGYPVTQGIETADAICHVKCSESALPECNGYNLLNPEGTCQSNKKELPTLTTAESPYQTSSACGDACTKVYECAAFTLSTGILKRCVLYGVSLSLSGTVESPTDWTFDAIAFEERGTDIVDSVNPFTGSKCYVKETPPTTRGTTLPPAAAAAANSPVQQPAPIAASAAAPQPELTAPSPSSGWSSTDTALTVLGGALAIGIAFGVHNHGKLGALIKRIVAPQSRIRGLGYAGLESTADLM